MALSTLLCRTPVRPLPAIELLDRFAGRKVRAAEETTLPNGLRVITARGVAPHSCVGLYSKAGSRYENIDGPRGVAWLANQSVRAGLTGRRWLVDGGVDREHSWVSLESAAGTTADAVRALGEAATTPKITTATVEALLPQLANETTHFRGSKWREYEDLTLSRAYETTGLGNSVYPEHFGRIADLKAQLVQNHAALVDVGNSAIVAVGDVNHEEVVEAAYKTLGNLKAAEGTRLTTQARFIAGSSFAWTKDHDCVVGAGYEGPPVSHSDAAAFMLLPHMWGKRTVNDRGEYGADSWDARRAALLGFTHEYRLNYAGFEDAGMFYFGAATPIEHGSPSYQQEQSVEYVMGGVLRWMYNLDDEEFLRAQARCLQYYAGESAPNAAAHARELGKAYLHHGRAIGLAEIAKRIAHMTKDDFRTVINRHLHQGQVQAVQVGGETYTHTLSHTDLMNWTWRARD